MGQQKLEKKPMVTRVLFVFDASNSMAGLWESDVKINIARKILINMIDSLQNFDNVLMALRVYGHQSPVPPQDCSDTRLEVPFAKNNASIIRQRLRYISPKGTTPIANSLAQSINDFTPCDNCRNIIILITDGIEACDGDPCAVSDDLQKKGITLKPFIIGIGIDEGFRETFDCIGHFNNAVHEDKFKELMNVVITQALNSTTAQINLLDDKGLPTETNVNMTFYDRYSGRMLYNYVHTINNRGNPDTLVLDPLVTYKVVIHTIPEVYPTPTRP
jgi:Ca-activated chloride channel family protein